MWHSRIFAELDTAGTAGYMVILGGTAGYMLGTAGYMVSWGVDGTAGYMVGGLCDFSVTQSQLDLDLSLVLDWV